MMTLLAVSLIWVQVISKSTGCGRSDVAVPVGCTRAILSVIRDEGEC